MSIARIAPLALALAFVSALGCRHHHQFERCFFFDKFEKQFGTSVQRARQYSLADQYRLFRFAMDVIHPPQMGMSDPIVERGAEAVPFLMDQLNADVDDVTVRDILHVFAMMQASGSYNVKADTSVMGGLASRVSGMKDQGWREICTRQLQRIRVSR